MELFMHKDYKKYAKTQFESGLTVTEFCKLHGLSRSTMYKQIQRLKEERSKKDINPNNFQTILVPDSPSPLVVTLKIKNTTLEIPASIVVKNPLVLQAIIRGVQQ